MVWYKIEETPPPHCKTVLLYRDPDLYPVVGFRIDNPDEDLYMLEEGGPEDGKHRIYPELAFAPTHWSHLPQLPYSDRVLEGIRNGR